MKRTVLLVAAMAAGLLTCCTTSQSAKSSRPVCGDFADRWLASQRNAGRTIIKEGDGIFPHTFVWSSIEEDTANILILTMPGGVIPSSDMDAKYIGTCDEQNAMGHLYRIDAMVMPLKSATKEVEL